MADGESHLSIVPPAEDSQTGQAAPDNPGLITEVPGFTPKAPELRAVPDVVTGMPDDMPGAAEVAAAVAKKAEERQADVDDQNRKQAEMLKTLQAASPDKSIFDPFKGKPLPPGKPLPDGLITRAPWVDGGGTGQNPDQSA